MAGKTDGGITGLILAGGKSTRMGGTDKASMLLNGRPMIEWVIDRFSPQVDRLILNANAPTDAVVSLGYPIVADEIKGFPGPLAGLHAGLSMARTPLLACVPCDAPLLPHELVRRLRDTLIASGNVVAVARTARGVEPTFLVCRATLRPSIEEFLAAGGRAFSQWLAQQHCVEAYFADTAAFSNINTPADLSTATARLQKS